MPLRIFPSTLPGEPIEEYDYSEGTLAQWIEAQEGARFDPDEPQALVATVRGEVWLPERWHQLPLTETVDLSVQPMGGVFKAIGSLISGVINTVFGFLMPKAPSLKQQTTRDNERLDLVSLKANTARLGQVVRELAGRHEIFPDYLLEVHKSFRDPNQPTKQWGDYLLCICVGDVQVANSEVLVSNTPLIALGADAEFTIYPPGADLSGDERAQWWYTAPEVGGTSTGTAGLELNATFAIPPRPEATSFVLSGFQIIIPDGAGVFQTGLAAGQILRVEDPVSYTIEKVPGARDRIRGNLTELDPAPGQAIEIVGDNAGLYFVESYQSPTPGSPAVAGSPSSLTGEPARLDYGVTPASFTVSRSGVVYTVTLEADAANVVLLASRIATELNATPLTAVEDGGDIRIEETGPTYSGAPLILAGGFTDVLGATPTSVTGTATSAATGADPGYVTLNFEDGSPVSSLSAGAAAMTLGYRGLRYRIVAATATVVEVERLTDTGATDVDWPGFIERSSTSAIVELDGSNLDGDWAGSFIGTLRNKKSNRAELDFMFPGGLGGIDDKGRTYAVTVTVDVDYRDADLAGAWSRVTYSWRMRRFDQLAYTETLDLPYFARWEFRARRVGAKSTRQSVQDLVQWYGLKCRIPAPTSYPGVSVMALRLRGGGRIATATENQISLIGTRVLDGVPTRQIAPFARYQAASIGQTFGPEMDDLDTIWQARGDTFDFVFDESTAREAINTTLGAGYAELVNRNGRLQAVRDQARTLTGGIPFSAQNITGGIRTGYSSARRSDRTDGVEVSYIDSRTWNRETVMALWPGDAGNKPQRVRIDGVTDRTRAWQHGMRVRAKQLFRNVDYRFAPTDMSGFLLDYLGYAPLIIDEPGWGQSSTVQSVGGSVVNLRDPMDWSGPGPFVFGYRDYEGNMHGPFPAVRGGSDSQLIVTFGGHTMPAEQRQLVRFHAFFGVLSTLKIDTLITSWAPSDMYRGSVTAERYDERVYLYDDADAPPE